MEIPAVIRQVYDHLDTDRVDLAVMDCLRLARHRKDHFSAAIFLRELLPAKGDFLRVLHDDAPDLTSEQLKFLTERSLERWIDSRACDDVAPSGGPEKNIFSVGVGELRSEIDQTERMIDDLKLPPGMDPYDLAAFTDRYTPQKTMLRLRIRALATIKSRIATRCLNYVILLERQLEASRKTESVLTEMQMEVNNFFLAHSDDVYRKLQTASHLVAKSDPENCSLLLTEVRRSIKAAADYFLPPCSEPVTCADGVARVLDDSAYLNRLHEYVLSTFPKSSSRELLRAELEVLAVLARRLNDVASKGVHTEVTIADARQGLLGLYTLLFNIVSRLQHKTEATEHADSSGGTVTLSE